MLKAFVKNVAAICVTESNSLLADLMCLLGYSLGFL